MTTEKQTPQDHLRPDATEIGASISRKYHAASTVPLNLAAMIAEAIEADRVASPHDHLRASIEDEMLALATRALAAGQTRSSFAQLAEWAHDQISDAGDKPDA